MCSHVHGMRVQELGLVQLHCSFMSASALGSWLAHALIATGSCLTQSSRHFAHGYERLIKSAEHILEQRSLICKNVSALLAWQRVHAAAHQDDTALSHLVSQAAVRQAS